LFALKNGKVHYEPMGRDRKCVSVYEVRSGGDNPVAQ